jgi:hypothetical protein
MPSAPPATAVAAVEWIEVAGHGFTSRSSPPMAQFNHRSQDIAGEGLDVSHQRDHNLALNTAINRRRSGSYAPSRGITSTWEGDPPVRRCQYHKGLGLTCESPSKSGTSNLLIRTPWGAPANEPGEGGTWTRRVLTYRRTYDTIRSSAGPVRHMAPDRVAHRTASPARRVVVQTVLDPRHPPRPALPRSGGSVGCRQD